MLQFPSVLHHFSVTISCLLPGVKEYRALSQPSLDLHLSVSSILWFLDTDAIIHTPLRNTLDWYLTVWCWGNGGFLLFSFSVPSVNMWPGDTTQSLEGFVFGSVNSEGRITNKLKMNKATKECLHLFSLSTLHLPRSRNIQELGHCSVRVNMFFCLGLKTMVQHSCQKPCWSSQGLSSFLVSSQPLPLGWATSVQHLSYNARHAVADANRPYFAFWMALTNNHCPYPDAWFY